MAPPHDPAESHPLSFLLYNGSPINSDGATLLSGLPGTQLNAYGTDPRYTAQLKFSAKSSLQSPGALPMEETCLLFSLADRPLGSD